MIDLHIHTHYSDGTDSVIELLKKAENLNLECISIQIMIIVKHTKN